MWKFYAQIAALVVLCSYLVFKWWQRERKQLQQRVIEDARWKVGAALDTSLITPRIHRLRRDYVAEARSSSQPAAYRNGLIASARRAIGCLSYFRRASEDDQVLKDREEQPHNG